MPTYEYRCKSCGHELEVQQSFSDDPLDTCPECGGNLRKVYGAVGISFKGSGFYKTDTRSSGGGNGKRSGGSDSSSSGDGSGGGSSKESSPDKSSPDKSSPDKSSSDKASTGATSSSSD